MKVQLEGARRPPDSVRGHGIVATIKVPRERFLNWDERHVILGARDIPYMEIPQGQRIQVGRLKAWLTPKSIVFYYPRGYSWFGDTAREVAGVILEDIIRHARKLERMMGMDSLKVRGYYMVKVSRQHYALIKNGLARYYNDPRRKLEVRDDKGLWLLIDNSFNLEETETVHPETATGDNKVIQDWANDLKRNPQVTASFVLDRFAETASQIKEAHGQLAMYARNLETHVSAVNNLSNQAQENAKSTVSLRDAVSRLAESLKAPPMPRELLQRLPEKALRRIEERASEPVMTEKACGLCGKVVNLPPGRSLCDECEAVVSEYRRPTRDSSITEYS